MRDGVINVNCSASESSLATGSLHPRLPTVGVAQLFGAPARLAEVGLARLGPTSNLTAHSHAAQLLLYPHRNCSRNIRNETW